jgi:iron complex transport system substrate-binding protein
MRLPRALGPAVVAAAVLSGGIAPGSFAAPAVWRDAMGREVRLQLPAGKIVSLAPSTTETLFALGAEARLVGVSRHCDYPVAAKLKPKMGDFNQPDLPKVIAAAPDVVLFTEFARAPDLAALEAAGITAFVLPARTVENVVDGIRSLGALTGEIAAADKLATEIEAAAREIGARLAGVGPERRPRVYIEVDGPQQLYAVGPGSFMDTVVGIAGGRNVFADRTQAYFPVSSAEVVAKDPQVVLIDYPFQYKVGVSKRAGWDAVAAVKNARVYDGTDYDIIVFNRPGPRITQALREIAALLHPDLFRAR